MLEKEDFGARKLLSTVPCFFRPKTGNIYEPRWYKKDKLANPQTKITVDSAYVMYYGNSSFQIELLLKVMYSGMHCRFHPASKVLELRVSKSLVSYSSMYSQISNLAKSNNDSKNQQ